MPAWKVILSMKCWESPGKDTRGGKKSETKNISSLYKTVPPGANIRRDDSLREGLVKDNLNDQGRTMWFNVEKKLINDGSILSSRVKEDIWGGSLNL